VDLYIHSTICLHGVVLNCFSTGTSLPFMFYNIHVCWKNMNTYSNMGKISVLHFLGQLLTR
jgi:hypothetical protein